MKLLPLGVVGRMVNTCDVLMALVPLLDNPPWVRRRKGETQKFVQNKWASVERAERMKLTPADAQVPHARNPAVPGEEGGGEGCRQKGGGGGVTAMVGHALRITNAVKMRVLLGAVVLDDQLYSVAAGCYGRVR